MKLLILACLLALGGPSLSRAEAPDPYNVYLWPEGDQGDWFEWWYYKVVDPVSGESFLFTYGVLNPGQASGAGKGFGVIEAGSFSQGVLATEKVPLSQFSARRDATEVRVGNNVATDRHLAGALTGADGQPIRWDLSVEKDWAFDAMGWAMHHAGLSNIYWYPAQASAAMSGTIEFRGKTYRFDHAPAYQDRNWGRSFPDWWTWLVSNDFKGSPGTVLAAGGGKPKVFNGPALFNSLCIGLRHQGKEYAFRSTDGDTVTFDIKWGKWEVTATNGHGDKIEISAYAPKEKFMLLPFQTPDGKQFYDYEALNGKMTVKLSHQKGFDWEPVATLETDAAGIEWGSPDPVSLARLLESPGKSFSR